jgi:hypothetical protein
MEGYASLRLEKDATEAKTKFSFVFELPRRVRMEAYDILGRTLYSVIIEEESAFFIIPSKKVYWRGLRSEILEKFLSFDLSVEDMQALFTGRWEEEPEGQSGDPQIAWQLKRDTRGRIISGERGALRFEVKEFFKGGTSPRLVALRHPEAQGQLKVLSLSFNKPVRKGVFELGFLGRFELKTWEEIEKMLADEN